ncbi:MULTISPECIES: hypothetical protein [unclassified Mesorhizobium]|uniref:hypothetical protein n=1 Tax=unclassified Mesorhizobium TaxID=325217 RepID=UPI000F74C80C|nr:MULTISPECIES: hypothetical protein [unclassified Mesorhizobium]AZO65435.1 hypothetical protein EJ075_10920 [Mesorhizobium sp. M6A.T.Cr.TU.016.01.1.1]RWP52426.1 MAG: hypothetical protein EOR06_20240 [Mesorhizobium sp.]RWQ75687.1 MAG: hypothetical protein EOS85_20595 [Mesorhizobium sp.]
MTATICKFCGAESKLVKSHIVPRSFYFLDNEMPHMSMPLDRVVRAKRSRTGIWDDRILCDECENKFGVWDDYAYRYLIGNFKKLFVCRDDYGILLVEKAFPVSVYSDTADRRKLRDFAISVLWRAHVSAREEMSGIDLGDHAEAYKRILTGQIDGTEKAYPLGIVKESNPDWRGIVSIIGRWDIGEAEIHRFSAGGYTFLVAASDISFVPDLNLLFQPYKGDKQMMLCKPESSSRFAQQMSAIAKANRDAHGDPWKGLRKAAN